MTAPDLGVLLGDSLAEQQRRRALQRAKLSATGLLALAALVYLATFLAEDGESGLVGFVRAAAEAGMVGGLADWFAVTALFRHPLGIPIPHTALVPTRKDMLAAGLGDFVTGHFLTADNVRRRLREAAVVPRVGRWLTSGDVAERAAAELVTTAATAVQAARPDEVADVLLDVVRRDSGRRSYASLAGGLLAAATDGGAHRPLLDVGLPYVRRSIVENRSTVHATIKSLAESSSFLAWLFTTDKRVTRLIDSALRLLREMEDDPEHDLRVALERLLRQGADDLRSGGELAQRLDVLVQEGLHDEATRRWLVDAVEGVLSSLRDTVADGPVTGSLAAALRRLGQRAQDDDDLRARLEGALERIVLHVVDRYAAEFTRLVEDTIAGWDGPATADRIEQAAGRDLQFIRINGTVVGALAGLVIHGVGTLLG